MGDRKSVEKYIIKMTERINPGAGNKEYFEEVFSKLSDAQFEKWIQSLENGNRVAILAPNRIGKDGGLNTERNFKIMEEMGITIFKRVYTHDEDGNEYLTPIPYPVFPTIQRRQEQTAKKGLSVAKDNNHIDERTGQPTGPSKGSKISFPQVQIMYSRGAKANMREFLKFRGGDAKARNEMEARLSETGKVRLSDIPNEIGEVKSKQAVRVFLKGAHLDNDI
jgi:hypothetical protein